MIKSPPHLKGEARCEWKRVVGELEKLDLLDTTDRGLLSLYCETYATWRQCLAQLEVSPAVVLLNNGASGISQWMKVRIHAEKLLFRYLQELGLSPSQRRKMLTPSESDDIPGPDLSND